jgi:hypothetical protein
MKLDHFLPFGYPKMISSGFAGKITSHAEIPVTSEGIHWPFPVGGTGIISLSIQIPNLENNVTMSAPVTNLEANNTAYKSSIVIISFGAPIKIIRNNSSNGIVAVSRGEYEVASALLSYRSQNRDATAYT